MARPEEPPVRDDLDALFEADQGMDEIFNAVRQQQDDDTIRVPKDVQYGGKKRSEDADVDEEIKITKKRAPIAKLDEKRLLSDNGISKLQNMSKTKFKFQGKGHEFSDVAKMLRMYQLWLDDLYPRAKFADGLTIIEKLGHTKRMQIQRKAWIEAGKPKEGVQDGEDVEPMEEEQADEGAAGGEDQHGGEVIMEREGSEESDASVDPMNLDLDRRKEPEVEKRQEANNGEEPDEDELDALLAAEETFSGPPLTQNSKPVQDRPPSPSFDDDEEAMREMDDMW